MTALKSPQFKSPNFRSAHGRVRTPPKIREIPARRTGGAIKLAQRFNGKRALSRKHRVAKRLWNSENAKARSSILICFVVFHSKVLSKPTAPQPKTSAKHRTIHKLTSLASRHLAHSCASAPLQQRVCHRPVNRPKKGKQTCRQGPRMASLTSGHQCRGDTV